MREMRRLLADRRFVGLLVLALALRWAWASLPLEAYLILLEDDAWMVAAIARHWALGHGITADGLTPTNGFQPLYPLTVGALPYLLGAGLDAGFRAQLWLTGLLNALVLLPLGALADRLGLSARVRWALLLAWALNPFVLWKGVNGMETSLGVLLGLAFLLGALQEPWPRPVLLGVLGGLAALARLDNQVLLIAFVLTWGLVRRDLGRLLPLGAGLAGVLLPYYLWNRIGFGSWQPSSGRALSYMHSYADSFSFTAPLQFVQYFGLFPLEGLPWWGTLPVWAALVGLGLFLAWRRGSWFALTVPLYAGGLSVYYGLLLQQGRPRYYQLAALLALLLFAWGWEVWGPPSTARRLAWAGLGLLLVLAWVRVVGAYREIARAPYLTQPAMYEAALWIRENLPPEARLGARNSGIFQYYSGRPVVNLDGKLNAEIVPVLTRRQLLGYLCQKEIGYLVGLESLLEYLAVYEARYADAPAHPEVGYAGKVRIYLQALLARFGLGERLRLDVRRIEELRLDPRREWVPLQTFPRPNSAEDPVGVFQFVGSCP